MDLFPEEEDEHADAEKKPTLNPIIFISPKDVKATTDSGVQRCSQPPPLSYYFFHFPKRAQFVKVAKPKGTKSKGATMNHPAPILSFGDQRDGPSFYYG